MTRNQLQALIVFSLAGITLASILVALQQALLIIDIVPEYYLPIIIFSLLTAFAILLSIPLSEAELSIAHAVGIVAFLALPAVIQPAMTIAICIGAIIGIVAESRWQYSRYAATMIRSIFVVTRVTLSFFVSTRIAIMLEANLVNPLLELIIFALIYIVIYFSIFALQIYSDARPIRGIIDNNLVAITTLLILPIPFSVVGAEVAADWQTNIVNFGIVSIGILLTVGALYALNYSEQKSQRQLRELRIHDAINNAMSGNLDISSILHNLHKQVEKLVDFQNFTVVLHDTTNETIGYPFIKQDNKVIDSTSYQPPDINLIRYILSTQTSLRLTNSVHDTALKMGIQPPKQNLSTWMGVPLSSGTQTIGALVLSSANPDAEFSTEDHRLLNTIAGMTSIAIQKAKLYMQKSHHADQLALLNQIVNLLSGTLSPDEVLDDIISASAMVSDSHSVAVYLYSQVNRTQLELVRDAGLSVGFKDSAPLPHLAKTLKQTHDLFSKPEPIIVSKLPVDADDEFSRRLQAEKKQAWIEIPLSISDTTLGVIVLIYDQPQNFSSEQINLLSAMATQAALAINNARLYTMTDEALERRMEQLFTLSMMGRLLNAAMAAEQIYDTVLQYALDATKAMRGVIILAEQHSYLIPAQQGYIPKLTNDKNLIEQGLTGRVLQQGELVQIGDVREERQYKPYAATTRSLMIVPIQRGNETLGIIRLEHNDVDAFSTGDSYFVSQIANQTVIAVDNTQLFHQIREGRDRVQVILNAMDEGIILIDNTQSVALANPRVDLLGFIPDELFDKPLNKLLADSHLNFAERLGFGEAKGLRRLLEDLQSRETWSDDPIHTYEVRSDYGLLSIQRQIIPVHDRQGQSMGVLLVFRNKTDEIELERARESFSQMIVHDLRSPLTAVTTSMKLLEAIASKDNVLQPVIEKATSSSQVAINKVLNRVDSLLDISKMESGTMQLDRQPTDFATLVDSVCIELSPLAHELNVAIHPQIPDELPLLDADSDKVERLLLNLVDNALKYSPEGGKIIIRASQLQDKPYVRADVIDMGPGVPDEHKTRLFQRFAQLDGRKIVRRGVGLGLAFCRMVTDAHEGDIWIEDGEESGSIFSFTLPYIQQKSNPKSSVAAS